MRRKIIKAITTRGQNIEFASERAIHQKRLTLLTIHVLVVYSSFADDRLYVPTIGKSVVIYLF